MSTKTKIIAAIIAIGAILIAIFQFGLGGPGTERGSEVLQTDSPVVMATSPEAMKEKKTVVVLPTQTIEITFNQPLENVPETKIVIEPKADYKVELSGDRKTLKIIPVTPYALGQGYSLFVKGETKFDGKKTLGSDVDFHFATISYNGV
jgi:hypothetical protein